MNRKAFTLIELLATIVIIALIMGLVLPSAMRVSNENKDKMCISYQDMMEEYAAVSPLKENYFIELDELDELDAVKEDCDGYVFVDHTTSPLEYKAYVVCSNGCATEGYNAEIGLSREHITIPSCKANVIYNGQQQSLVTISNKYILTNNLRKDVGTQNVQVDLSDKRIYSWTDDSQDNKVIRKCSLLPRQITLKANDLEFTYLETPPQLAYTLINTVPGEDPLASPVTYKVYNSSNQEVTITSTSDAGTYRIVPNSTVTSNYTIKIEEGTLTIHKAPNPITVSTPQNWDTIYSTSVQNHNFTAAANAQGTVTYSIVSQKKGNTDVSVFSIPDAGVASIRLNARATAGTYTVVINASAEGNKNYLPGSKEITLTVVVDKARFTCTTSKGDYTYAQSGTGTAPSISNNPESGSVTYYRNATNSTSGGTAWSGTTSTSLDAGTYYVYAVVGETTNYYGTTCSTGSFKVGQADCTMTSSDATMKTGANLDMSTKASNNKGTVSCTIKTNGTTTASTLSGCTLTAGAMSTSNDNNQTVVVTLTDSGSKNYKGCSKDSSVTVQKYTRTLSWNNTTPADGSTLTYGTSYTATASATGSGGTAGTISYSSNNTSYATINSSTGVIEVKNGNSRSVTITASLARTSTVKTASVSRTYTTKKHACELSVSNATMKTGTTLDMSTKVSGSHGTLSYTIKTNGTTTGSTLSGSTLTAGAMSTSNDSDQTVVVTISDTGNDNYEGCSKDSTITVQKYTRTLSWGSGTPSDGSTLTFGTSYTATASASGSGGTSGTISYASSNTTGATIGASDGKITVKNGNSKSVTITASLARTSTVKATSISRTYTTKKAGCTMTAGNATIKTGATLDVSTKASSPSGTVACTIKTNGTTTGSTISGCTLTAGAMSTSDDSDQTVVVTLTDAGTDNYEGCSKDSTITVQKYTRTLSWTSSSPAASSELVYGTGYTATASASGSGGTAGTISYSSSNTNFATINSSTGAIEVKNGNSKSVTMTATLSRTATVKAASTTRAYTTKKASCTMTVSNATIKTGATLDVSTKASSAKGTVSCTIKTNGTTTKSTISGCTLTAGAMSTDNDSDQTVVVTISDTGNDNYEGCSKDSTVTVQKYTRTLSWASSAPAAGSTLTFGTSYTATASASGSGGTAGTISYSSSDANVATIGGSDGKITVKNGNSKSVTMTASLSRTATVKAASTTRAFTTGKANSTAPTLTSVSVNYDGKEHCITVSGGTSGLTTEYAIKTSGSSSWSNWTTAKTGYCQTNTGKWDVKARKAGNDNYNTSSESASKTLEIILNDPAVISCSNLEYTGSAQSGCTCSGGTITGDTSKTDVGTYTVGCTPDSTHTKPDDKTWKITRKPISVPTCSSVTWTGSEQTLFAAHDAEYKNTKLVGTDAGDYDVSVTPNSNWQWTDGKTTAKTVTCTIVGKKAATHTCSVGTTVSAINTKLVVGRSANNYVKFNCDSNNNCEIWRILSIDTNCNNLKIIRTTPTVAKYSTAEPTAGWQASTLKTYLNGTYYNGLTDDARAMIIEATWYEGMGHGDYNASTAYANAKKNTTYNNWTGTWSGKVGLINVYEYLYAARKTDGTVCANDNSIAGKSYNANGCDAWIIPTSYSYDLWTMNSYTTSSNNVGSTAAFNKDGYVTEYLNNVGGTYYRPVVYLTSTVKIASGAGTSSNPWVLTK